MSPCERRATMTLGSKCRALAMLLLSAITLATANASKAEAAGGDGDLVPAPVVLRGSPPPHPLPYTALPACPPGYDYDPSVGCIAPGDAYASDYGYWPA